MQIQFWGNPRSRWSRSPAAPQNGLTVFRIVSSYCFQIRGTVCGGLKNKVITQWTSSESENKFKVLDPTLNGKNIIDLY